MLYIIQVTYVLKGGVRHEDFCGHKGTIGPGDLQVFHVFQIYRHILFYRIRHFLIIHYNMRK